MGIFSALYGLGLSCKKALYRNPRKLPAPVISIGNLTLGGTGKTPAVIALAREARKRGHHPCILTRGYKGTARDISFVSRGDGPLLSPEEAGDEPYLMARTLRNVMIIKGSDRFRAGVAAYDNPQLSLVSLPHPSLFLLDDGYQHWKLFRNVDVLLINATNPFSNGKLFPEGMLREPFQALGRAHLVVITHADLAGEGAVTEITRTVRKHNQESPVFTASHSPCSLVSLTGEEHDLSLLTGKRVFAFSGIAGPGNFETTLTASGAHVASSRSFRDHHQFTQKDLDSIKADAGDADMVITTEKDLVKVKDLACPGNMMALKIEFSVSQEFYESLFSMIS